MSVARKAAWGVLAVVFVLTPEAMGQTATEQSIRRLPPTTSGTAKPPMTTPASEVATPDNIASEEEGEPESTARLGLSRLGRWSNAVKRSMSSSAQKIRGASPLEYVRDRLGRSSEPPVDPFVAAETLPSEAVAQGPPPQAETQWSVFPVSAPEAAADPTEAKIEPIATTVSSPSESTVQRTSAAISTTTADNATPAAPTAESSDKEPGRFSKAFDYSRRQAKSLFGFLRANDDTETPSQVDTVHEQPSGASDHADETADAKAGRPGRSIRFGRLFGASGVREKASPVTSAPSDTEADGASDR